MAQSTVTQLLSKFTDAGFYPDCPDATATTLFNDALKWMTWKLRLRTTMEVISLTQGTREYDLPDDLTNIREAYYQPSATADTWQVLQGTTRDLLARVDTGWLADSSQNVPQRYYVDQAADSDSGKRIIGFDQVPQVTTSGGYPNVTLYTVETADLTLSETMPIGIYTDDVLLYEMAYRWAIRQDPERVDYWKGLRDEALAETDALNKSVVDDAPPQIFLSPFTNRTSRAV